MSTENMRGNPGLPRHRLTALHHVGDLQHYPYVGDGLANPISLT